MKKTVAKKVMKALTMLKTHTSVSDRAELFAASIKRNIQRDVIDKLTEQKENLQDRLIQLKEFNLATNLNSGLRAMNQADCEARFKEIIGIEFDLKMLEAEIKVKTESFNTYFGD